MAWRPPKWRVDRSGERWQEALGSITWSLSHGDILMRHTFGYYLKAALVCAVGIALQANPAPAMAQLLQGNPGYIPNVAFEGVANLSNTGYTNATTTPTILTGTAITVPATGFDPAKRLLVACWSADVFKATSGTGQIAVAQDGVPIAASYRYTSSNAARNGVSECYAFFRTTQLATTISLYAVSSDTASFAVTNAQLLVRQVAFN